MKTLWIGILAAGLIAPVAAHARSREEKQGERMEKQGEKREKRAEKEEKAGTAASGARRPASRK